LPSWLLLSSAAGTAQDDFAAMLPATTKAYVSTTDVSGLEAGWNATGFGRLLADKAMQPFRNEFDRYLRRRTPDQIPAFGLTWQQLKSVAAGEACAALLETPAGKPAWLVLVKVPQRDAEVAKLREDLRRVYSSAGARITEKVIGGSNVTIFELPSPQPGGLPQRRAYFVKGDMLGVTDNAGALSQLGGDLGDRADRTLAQRDAYRYCETHCAARFRDGPAQLRWFLDPFAVEALLRRTRGDAPSDAWQWIRRQGFTAIRGMGGALRFGGKNFESFHRYAIYAPGPFELAAGMLNFPNVEQFELPAWLPADIGRVTVFQWDLDQALTAYGHLFDEWYGEGERGVFEEVLVGIREDPGSPGVDIHKDLIAQLQGTVVSASIVANDAEEPVDQTLFAIEVRDRQAVATAVRRLLEGDPDVMQLAIAGETVWVFRETGTERKTDDLEPEESSFGPDLSNYAVCQWREWLLVATDPQWIKAILEPARQAATLQDQPDYQRVMQIIARPARQGTDLRRIGRPQLDFVASYHLLRAGRLQQSSSLRDRLLAGLLDLVAGADPPPSSGNRQSGESDNDQRDLNKLDFSRLPRFDLVKHHFTTSGLVGQRRGDGWVLFGFTLGKQND
jgi:hypothetical protein